MFRKSSTFQKKKKTIFAVLMMVSFLFTPVTNTETTKAFTGNMIGEPSKPGDVVYSAGSPVQNFKIQTVYTGTNPTGKNDICVARATWNPPKSGIPGDATSYRFYVTGGDKSGLYNDKKISLSTNTIDANGLTCGVKYNFFIGIIKPLGSLDQSLGDANVQFTLAKPAASDPTNYNISWKGLTTNKTGSTCTATLSWNGPAGNLNDTRIKYRAIVAPNAGQGFTAQYTSGDLANTVFSQTTTGMPCGKDYTAEVMILVDGAKQRTIQKGFRMPATTAADGTTTPEPAGTDPTNIDEGKTTGTTTDITDPAESGGKSAGCEATCNQNKWGWLSPTKEIKDMICNMQCTVIQWMADIIGAMINGMLVKSIL